MVGCVLVLSNNLQWNHTAFKKLQQGTLFSTVHTTLWKFVRGVNWRQPWTCAPGHYEYWMMPFGFAKAPMPTCALIKYVLEAVFLCVPWQHSLSMPWSTWSTYTTFSILHWNLANIKLEKGMFPASKECLQIDNQGGKGIAHTPEWYTVIPWIF